MKKTLQRTIIIGFFGIGLLNACNNNSTPQENTAANHEVPAHSDVSSEDEPAGTVHPSDLVDEEPDWTEFHTPWDQFEQIEIISEWFDVYRIFPDVYALYESGQWEQVISYLIVGDDRALLFDTGFGIAPLRPIVLQLTDKDIFVINSHSHYDHVGGNYEFAKISGPDSDYARANAKGVANEIAREFVPADTFSRPPPESFDIDTYSIKPYEVTAYIGDGDVIDLGGITLKVFETPGHSPDSLCLFDEEGRRLFTGDTIYPAELYGHVIGADFADYKASIDRLSALEPSVDTLITAHVLPVMDANYLGKVKVAFDEIAGGKSPDAITDGIYQYNYEGFSVWLRAPGER